MKKILIFVLFIIIMLFSFGCSKKIDEVAEKNVEEIPVEVSNPVAGSISKNLILNGVLKPINEVMVFSKTMGSEKIVEININEGNFVEEGDILVKIDDEGIKDQVEATYLSFKNAKSNYYQMKDSYEDGKEAFENAEKLYFEGAISKDQFETAKIQASNYQNEIIEGQLNQAKLAYDTVKKQLEDSTIVAPISGIVSDLNFVENGYASAQSYLKISDTSKLKIELEFTELDINKISLNQDVKVDISNFDGAVLGKIEELNTVADGNTGLYSGVVVVNNSEFTLKSGMVVKVNISIDDNKNAFILPVNSVLSDENGYFVYSVVENMPNKKRVLVGDDNGEIIEILSGIDSNDKIVVKGQEFIKDSSNVKIVRGE